MAKAQFHCPQPTTALAACLRASPPSRCPAIRLLRAPCFPSSSLEVRREKEKENGKVNPNRRLCRLARSFVSPTLQPQPQSSPRALASPSPIIHHPPHRRLWSFVVDYPAPLHGCYLSPSPSTIAIDLHHPSLLRLLHHHRPSLTGDCHQPPPTAIDLRRPPSNLSISIAIDVCNSSIDSTIVCCRCNREPKLWK
ncbi:unnamed protein product [Linum trigynum]|uniref:Uncharacterized protein n=1 Tax=Linum trigynum TaxID=586398 RepID=A0AAV2EXF5_9ROSI